MQRLNQGLGKLPERTREIFLLQRIEGLTYRDIAATLDVSKGTVDKHMAKAMMFLAGWLEGYQDAVQTQKGPSAGLRADRAIA